MKKALIVGGGIGGLAAASSLVASGFDVELIERESEIHALGSGITLIGAALRALDRLGVYEECTANGYGMYDFELYDPAGNQITKFPLPRAVGPTELPGMMGMMRPELHRILLANAKRKGVTMRTGSSPTQIELQDASTKVTFSDGGTGEYDLVVGADGLRSSVREMVFGPMQPTFLGQGIFRVVLPKPDGMTTETQQIGGGETTIGFTPTSDDSCYLYALFPIDAGYRPAAGDMHTLVRERLEGFGGFGAQARESINESSPINYTQFESLVLPAPWNRKRVVMLGDAAHCTTPHLAAGGAMCLEDAVALGEELAAAESIDDGLSNYTKRRFDRCKYVVDTSAQISYWETHPDTPGADHKGLMGQAFAQLAEPF